MFIFLNIIKHNIVGVMGQSTPYRLLLIAFVYARNSVTLDLRLLP